MLTGENKEQFEKWLIEKYFNNIHFNNINDVIGFNILPFEMQVGVYLAYYEDRFLINAISYDNQFYWKAICNHELNKRHYTRNEALKEALKKADKLTILKDK